MSIKGQNEQLLQEVKNFNPRRSLLGAAIVILLAIVLKFILPDDPADFGFFCTLPAILLIAYIFATKRIIEALTLAAAFGFIMVTPMGDNPLWTFADSLQAVMAGDDIPWLIIVCGLMGGIIALIERAGGALAFGNWAATKAKSEKMALMWAWVLGCVIFIDDYLNSCTVGACMAPLTDKYRTPREMLAYVCDSTAAPLCVLIPITTWGAFAGKIMVNNGWVEDGAGPIEMFTKTIPFDFYAWLAAIMVPCVIFGIMPKIGPMKAAYERTASGGPLAPPGSDKISILSSDKGDIEYPDNPKIINFFVPIGVLIGSTIIFDTEMVMGVICTLIVMFIMYMAQGLFSADEFWDLVIKGLQNMILPLMLMVMAFVFADMNDQIGFTKWCIETAAEHMSPASMPVLIFLVLAVTEFICGSNWGMYIIALPIVIPLAMQIGVHMPLAVASVLSAGVFGSHICFYSDATVITSAACGCDNFRHSITQMPFGFVCAGLSAILFLIFGFVMA